MVLVPSSINGHGNLVTGKFKQGSIRLCVNHILRIGLHSKYTHGFLLMLEGNTQPAHTGSSHQLNLSLTGKIFFPLNIHQLGHTSPNHITGKGFPGRKFSKGVFFIFHKWKCEGVRFFIIEGQKTVGGI